MTNDQMFEALKEKGRVDSDVAIIMAGIATISDREGPRAPSALTRMRAAAVRLALKLDHANRMGGKV